jgi:hypothetical protein
VTDTVGTLVDHPFLVGLGVALVLAVGLSFVPHGALSPAAVRGLGLCLFVGVPSLAASLERRLPSDICVDSCGFVDVTFFWFPV